MLQNCYLRNCFLSVLRRPQKMSFLTKTYFMMTLYLSLIDVVFRQNLIKVSLRVLIKVLPSIKNNYSLYPGV
jgi:hypothetical protein